MHMLQRELLLSLQIPDGIPPGPAAGGGGLLRLHPPPSREVWQLTWDPYVQATEALSFIAMELLQLPGKARRNMLNKKSAKNIISHKSLRREKSPAVYIFQSNLEDAKEMKGFPLLHCHLSWGFTAHWFPQQWLYSTDTVRALDSRSPQDMAPALESHSLLREEKPQHRATWNLFCWVSYGSGEFFFFYIYRISIYLAVL